MSYDARGMGDMTTGSPSIVTSGPNRARPSTEVDYRTVLVPLDGSPAAARALETAGWLARRFEAGLHVIAAAVARPETRWYERYLGTLIEAHPEITSARRSDDPDVAAAIDEATADLAPCLVCLATHGWSRSPGSVGSTFAAIASAATGPLVAVGPRSRPDPAEAARRLVACVDGSPTAELALPIAAGWARRLGWRLSIVTAAEHTPPPIIPGAHRHRAFGPDADPDDYVQRLAQRLDFAGLDVDAEVIWDRMSPHRGLADHLESHPATLLALTTHARTGIARVVLGSEAARIIHASPVPVLVHPVGASHPAASAPSA
jgi:nucleotide-binding universal stress UspA family protein